MKKTFLTLLLAGVCLCNAHAFGFNDVLLWIPNRVMDFTDIVSWGAGFCGGAKVGARVTRAIDFNLGDAFYIVIRKDYNRWISGSLEQGHSFSFIYFGTENYQVDELWGFKMWEFPLEDNTILHKGKKIIYQYDWWENPFEGNYKMNTGTRDWWEIAVEAGLLAYGRVAVHPVEIADFLLGIFFIDFKEDDISLSEE